MSRITLSDVQAGLDPADHAVEIAPRTWWVGHKLPGDPFQCHVYLLEQGRDSVLLDPGPRESFPVILDKVRQVVPFDHVRYFLCHHQDPDITSALPQIDTLVQRDDAVIVTDWRAQALIKHYGLRTPFWLVDANDWRLPLADRSLEFVFTPYAHFPGAFCSFDRSTGVLFSSDLFGGFTESFQLIARDEGYFEQIRSFHEHYIPSREVLDHALDRLEPLPVSLVAPQHGSLVPEDLFRFVVGRLRHMECGLYLLSRGDTDVQRLSQLNQAMEEITETMLVSRDFQTIAERLLEVVQRVLPADGLEFYAALENGRALHLAPATRYRGAIVTPPPEVVEVFASSREDWAFVDGNGGERKMVVTCSRRESPRLLLPLFSEDADQVVALASLRLRSPVALRPELEQVLDQVAYPLQVAVEREVLHRTLDRERARLYERAVRDPLTGLYNRHYLHDAVARLFDLHDRDPGTDLGLIIADIDHFKGLNDTYGHPQGDQVLTRLAHAFMANTRQGDLCVRLGGEEFAVFAVGRLPSTLEQFAERLRQALEALEFEGVLQGVRVTMSMGAAMRRPGESLEDLMARADRALYRAKRSGRNRVVSADAERKPD